MKKFLALLTSGIMCGTVFCTVASAQEEVAETLADSCGPVSSVSDFNGDLMRDNPDEVYDRDTRTILQTPQHPPLTVGFQVSAPMRKDDIVHSPYPGPVAATSDYLYRKYEWWQRMPDCTWIKLETPSFSYHKGRKYVDGRGGGTRHCYSREHYYPGTMTKFHELRADYSFCPG